MKEMLRQKMGALLKLERERLNINRQDLADQLKMADAHLQLIEEGTSQGLPSDVYFELFAKSYAEAIGVDYVATIDAMKEEIGAAAEPAESSRKKSQSKPAEKLPAVNKQVADDSEIADDDLPVAEPEHNHLKRLGWLLGAVAAVFVLFIVAYSVFWSSDVTPISGGGTEQPSEATRQLNSVDDSPILVNYNWDVPEYTPPQPLVLKIRARDASWATVLADGDTAIYRGLGAGREYVVTANYRIQVSIALPQAVETELNGKVVELSDPESHRISRVVIDQMSLKWYLDADVETVEDTWIVSKEPSLTSSGKLPDTTTPQLKRADPMAKDDSPLDSARASEDE